jgi:hypothetical protein
MTSLPRTPGLIAACGADTSSIRCELACVCHIATVATVGRRKRSGLKSTGRFVAACVLAARGGWRRVADRWQGLD